MLISINWFFFNAQYSLIPLHDRVSKYTLSDPIRDLLTHFVCWLFFLWLMATCHQRRSRDQHKSMTTTHKSATTSLRRSWHHVSWHNQPLKSSSTYRYCSYITRQRRWRWRHQFVLVTCSRSWSQIIFVEQRTRQLLVHFAAAINRCFMTRFGLYLSRGQSVGDQWNQDGISTLSPLSDYLIIIIICRRNIERNIIR